MQMCDSFTINSLTSIQLRAQVCPQNTHIQSLILGTDDVLGLEVSY